MTKPFTGAIRAIWEIEKRVRFCSVEPKAERPNAWETHESTEPIMNCAKCIRQLKKPSALGVLAVDIIGPAWLSFGR